MKRFLSRAGLGLAALFTLAVAGSAQQISSPPAGISAITAGNGLSGGTITAPGSGTISLTAPVSIANGGTNATTASGTSLDNITGFASIGHMKRTGSGAYSFLSASGIFDEIGSTRGQILYRGASGWLTLAPDTTGKVLSTNGAGADPSWIAAAGTGTVTSVVGGAGLTGGTITTTGTLAVTIPQGQVKLDKNGANLRLCPTNGRYLTVNGVSNTLTTSCLTLAAPSNTVTISNSSPATITWNAHGLIAGRPVVFSTSGALPTGITAGTIYYVLSASLTANDFQISTTPGGSAINTSSAGSGTHKIGTLRYIYATASAGAINALEASTTVHATSTTSGNQGVEIKAGDDTRTLVGMAFDDSTQWLDSATQRYVRSWFNEAGRYGTSTLASSANTTSSTFAVTNLKVEALTWLNERVTLDTRSFARSGSAANAVYMTNAVDGTAAGFVAGSFPASGSGGTNEQTMAAMHDTDALAEGYHYFAVLIKNSDNSTTSTLVQSANTSPTMTLRTLR